MSGTAPRGQATTLCWIDESQEIDLVTSEELLSALFKSDA